MFPGPIVSLVEQANFMNAPSLATGSKAPVLQEALDAAHEWVEDKVGPLDSAARSYRVYVAGRSRTVVLPVTHVEEIVTITDPSGEVVTVDANRDVNYLAGIIELPRTARGSWQFEVRTRDTKAAFILAVKIIAEHLYGTQRGSDTSRGGMQAQPSDAPRGFAIPHRAAQIIEPYRKLPGTA